MCGRYHRIWSLVSRGYRHQADKCNLANDQETTEETDNGADEHLGEDNISEGCHQLCKCPRPHCIPAAAYSLGRALGTHGQWLAVMSSTRA